MISVEEHKELQKELDDDDDLDASESEELMDYIYDVLQYGYMESDDSDDFMYAYMSDVSQPFETMFSKDFTVEGKQGLYLEIFYSPYFDEVLQVAVFENCIDGNGLAHSMFRSQRQLWMELQPGEYTIEINLYRTTEPDSDHEHELH